MQLNIEEQLPISTKIYKNNLIMIPISARNLLNWNEGDKLELYPTTKGIFITKGVK